MRRGGWQLASGEGILGKLSVTSKQQSVIGEASDCGYISPADGSQLNSGLEEIGRMLNSMMEKADLFCGSPDGVLHEAPTTDR